ncbi:MAG: FMN-binding protein [Bacillota bacterium]|nr:FMN-binding protein [Bacillota bacterium]
MKKKNKIPQMLLLPLFLGAVCLISSAALIGVNALTAPRIAAVELEKQNKGYMELLGLDSLMGVNKVEEVPTGACAEAGAKARVSFVKDGTNLGVVYDVTVGGYGGEIKFQVGFKDRKYTGFLVVSHIETPTDGGVLLAGINDQIKGLAADDELPISLTDYAGATITRNPVVKALKACAADYLTMEGV